MKRLRCFALAAGLAIGLSTAAHAETFSFMVGGHHISISAPRNCDSFSCVSVSIPGIVTTHRRRSDVATAQENAQGAVPARPAPKAPAIAAPAPWIAPAPAPQTTPSAAPAETKAAVPLSASPPSPPPTAPELAATDSKDVAAPPPPPAVALPAPDPVPVPKAAKMVDIERDDTPLGDWQTEGKTGAVRIEACGKALCGYLINPSSQAKGESILINMKPKTEVQWRGSIFSRASGNTYNATMTLKTANLLRVEACALGHFFCSGNDWTRIVREPLVTSRGDDNEPRS